MCPLPPLPLQSPWLWYRVLRAIGGHRRATVRSPGKSALAPGDSDIRVVFAAFIWFPTLCACACNYQRHTPILRPWAALVLVSPNI